MGADKNCKARTSTATHVVRLCVVVVAMFGFGYLLVPIYDLFCEVTGVGGRTGVVSVQQVEDTVIDKDRLITVEFTSTAAQSMPWEFRPKTASIKVHPGEVAEVFYYAKNITPARMAGQAVPSVSPQASAKYFNKTECFCFTNQVLEAGESKDMLVRFVVDPGLPKTVNTITLSYAFFRLEDETKDTGTNEQSANARPVSQPAA